jgi:hypothetical protein
MGWSTSAGEPERRHLGFTGLSGGFVTVHITVVGRARRAALPRRCTGSDMGSASRACDAGGDAWPATRAVVGRTRRPGPVVGSTANGERSRSATRRARAVVGCARRAFDRASHVERLGPPVCRHAPRAADCCAVMGRPRRIETTGAGLERARGSCMGHSQDRRARRAAGSFVVRPGDQTG